MGQAVGSGARRGGGGESFVCLYVWLSFFPIVWPGSEWKHLGTLQETSLELCGLCQQSVQRQVVSLLLHSTDLGPNLRRENADPISQWKGERRIEKFTNMF